ncbi:hypothetical protein [Klebsiella pneumoniae]|uniref:hypothetical protein n=1 Tax=Klebsiella pneumoniae TaxID=573 RepID=UPI000F218B78|nr:hypothetical protein [Klebsiella pneumoniae]VDB02820.1 hypothetical protein BANRA_05752 [Klebsiella pneumoniae]
MITTRRMLMLYACLVPVALTGCDLADYFPNVPQPVPVISPGYQVDIDGHPVRISGFDDCPREKDEARHAAAQDEKGCIVLSAERSEVKVRLYQPAGASPKPADHPGKDARQNDIIRLQRPNGALVMQNLQGKSLLKPEITKLT